MKKLFLLLICFLLILPATAADFEINEDYSVIVDKESLLAALYEADISSLRQAIDLQLISCYELTEYYLERIETYNESYQCFITLCDNALQIARERDAAIANGTAKGSLFGIPIVVKDNIEYEGYPTTNGIISFGPQPSEKSAAVVQNLLNEGAIILGKTNMAAAAQDAVCSINSAGMQTYNAYNPHLASGGSSGGSAAAVCLNFAVAGLGTDTNVSLRYPSALNGCVSLRPTIDLLDKEGCIVLNASRDTPGAITRNVMDQAIMLDALSGGSYSKNLDDNALDGMRIGVLSELSYAVQSTGYRSEKTIDSEIAAAFDNAISELTACGAEVVEVSMPSIFSDIYAMSAPSETLYQKLESLLSDNKVEAIIYPTYLHSPHYTSKEYLKGKSVYELPYICNCATFSPLTGAPEITVPIGSHSSGAGIGLEILSLKHEEQLLLNIAYSYTKRYNHRAAPQDAPSLYFGEMELTLHAYLNLYQQALDVAEAQKNAPPETTAITEEVIVTEPDTITIQMEEPADLSWLWYTLAAMILLLAIASFIYYKHNENLIFK